MADDGNQESKDIATDLWDNALAVQGSIPSVDRDKVLWPALAEALSAKFMAATNGRGLTSADIQYLTAKAFSGKSINMNDLSQMQITWNNFAQDPVANRNFTFCQWLCRLIELTEKHLRGPWCDGSIMGFVSREQAQELLMSKPVGTFLLRFSDSQVGGVSIAWVGENEWGERQVLNLQPYISDDFIIRSLADRIKDLGQLVYLYPDIPKHVAFHTYYSSMERTQVMNDGVYVPQSIKAIIPWTLQEVPEYPHRRYSKDGRRDWQVSDISSHTTEGLIVAWVSRNYHQTCIDILSRNSQLIFVKSYSHKDVATIDDRFIASLNSKELVTGCGQEVQVITTAFFGVTLNIFRLLKGAVTCLSVSSSGSIIYVGSTDSCSILALGRDMQPCQTISPSSAAIYGFTELAAIDDKIIVCSAVGSEMTNGKVIMVDVKSNQEAEYRTILGKRFSPKSITCKEDTRDLFILWSFTYDSGYYSKFESHITCHSVDMDRQSCQSLSVLTGSARKVATAFGNKLAILDSNGDINFTDIVEFFSFDNLMKSLAEVLLKEDCIKLCKYFQIGERQTAKLLTSGKPGKLLLTALEEKGIVQRTDVITLHDSFSKLNMTAAFHLVEGYLNKTRYPPISTFEKFVAEFSTFLTSNLFEAMCKHFNISGPEKSVIMLDKAPGLSLLTTLIAKGIIMPSNVRALEIPAFGQLKQLVAKINRYQKDVRERGMSSLRNQSELTFEEKAQMFCGYLHLHIKHWYESICPLPWKKASKWDLSDLFIACGLTLTNTKCQTVLKNIDPKCIVTYADIFTHKELKDAPRIVVEGDPGSGKTMLASQIAYDWMNGKLKDIKYAILLQLKYVEDMTIPEAITKLLIPKESPLTTTDVEGILAETDPLKVCLILDGLEEYTGAGNNSDPSQSKVMKVMNQEVFPHYKVILTTRSEYLADLPKCPMLKIRQFGKEERDKYVEKIFPHDNDKHTNVTMAIESNPLLLELCDVPLLFVMAVHNIETITKLSEDETTKVTPFVRSITQTLCTTGGKKVGGQDEMQKGTISSEDSKSSSLTLAEVAFNGLCTGKQQLSWSMNFIQDGIRNFRSWIDSGILIVEEDIRRIKNDITEQDDTTSDQTQVAGKVAEFHLPSDKTEGVVTAVGTDDAEPKMKDDGASPCTVDGGIQVEVIQPTLATTSRGEISQNTTIVLQARFLHKIIQEWFAAKHLANILENFNQDEADQCLKLISPIEFHYILRFACGMNAKVTPLILRHLDGHIHGLAGDKWGPVSNCFCQCFLEHSGDTEALKEIVRNFCKEGITVCEEDSRQLQKAKIALLNFASENKILVQKVNLVDVCEHLQTEGNVTWLCLNSGAYLYPLQEVHSLMISSWSPKLEDFDYNLLMQYLGDWSSLKEVDLHFPVPPPVLEEAMDKISLSHKTEQTDEEMIKCKKFGREVVELLSREPHHSISFSRFIPAYHRFFNRQCKVGDYGVNKLMELFEALPNIVKVHDEMEKTIVLSDAERLAVLSRMVNQFLPQSKDRAITTASVAPTFMKYHGWCPNWQELGLRNCRHLLSKFPHVMEVFKEGSSERVYSVEHQQLNQLTHRTLVVLLDTRDGQLSVKQFQSEYERVWKIPLVPTEYGYSQLVLLLKALYHVVIVRDEWSDASKVELTPTYQFARQASIILKKVPQRAMTLAQFGKRYGEMFRKDLVPSDFGHTTLQSLISAVPWVLSLIGKGNRRFVSLHEFTTLQIPSVSVQVEARDVKFMREISADSAIVKMGEVTSIVPNSPNRQVSSDGSTNSLTWSIGKITYHLEESGVWQLRPVKNDDSSPVFDQPQGPRVKDEPKPMETSLGATSTIDTAETGGVSLELQQDDSRPKKHRNITCGNKETLVTNTLEVQAVLSQEEGSIHIENSGVELYFPKNSFNEDSHDHFIEMRIIPHYMLNEPAKSFTDDSSVMVELLPNNLELRNPAVLTLPHCLVLKDCDKCKVQIFTSHHAKGENPVWEEITASTKYILTESYCKIWLQRFCWVTYTIGGEQVEAKKLMLYTAGRRYKPEAKRVTIDVGYYPQLPGENEQFLKKSQTHIIGCEQSFIFRRTPKDDLCITLTKTVPETWKILELLTETIEYPKIELSCEQSCFFTLLREGGEAELPNCTFSASQGEMNSKLYIEMKHDSMEMSPTSDEQEKIDSRIYEQLNRNVNVATSLHRNNEGDYSIQPQLGPFSPSSNIPMMPQGEHAVVPASSCKQFSYQHSLLLSGMSNLLLNQYPTGMASAVQYPSLPLYGSHLSREEMFPLSCELLNELELKLGVTNTFNGDWRILAEKLGFKEDEVTYLKSKNEPTIEVLHVAFSRGSFKTLDDLIPILTEMRRIDVVRILTKHKKNTEVSNVNESF